MKIVNFFKMLLSRNTRVSLGNGEIEKLSTHPKEARFLISSKSKTW